ncbi:MAG TPA: arginine deiminase family protein [Candidatus Limnocylindrales bacterium]|nr:arginine deiminase family protein [Candidatus Limnocylindrales bacterium]
MFQRAIVRKPGDNFANGLTSAGLGMPDLSAALSQHEAYCRALESCGLQLIRLPADLQHPDSTFVEDTAILTSRSAILTRPGAASRLGEVTGVRETIDRFYSSIHQIAAPGTLDGGDICEAGSHFFIGISHRTNQEGARQLSQWLAADGFTSSMIDIRDQRSILHLKSGIAYLDKNDLVVMEELASREEFSGYNRIRPLPEESYACNCVLVNDRVLVPAGFPRLQEVLSLLGYKPLPLDMSEFRKMDGGLSCLSLRF